jgi:isopenicillin N synthase-like dioxygenase
MTEPLSLPVIDMTSLFQRGGGAKKRAVAGAIEVACRTSGFFYVTGHGIPSKLFERLEAASRNFFALPTEEKAEIAMALGGRAWRGWFPVGNELTSVQPDIKEGLYLGTELAPDHPRVQAGWPLHGANLWPRQVPELRAAALDYMGAATRAGHALISGVALSLGLEAEYFARHYTSDPTILFRIFNYPADPTSHLGSGAWGVGEHTDYGLLTLLAQDEHDGLQVKQGNAWIDVPPRRDMLVCNIGDMLDRLTGGHYRSALHRVRNRGRQDRLSFPLFFDPDFAAEIRALPEYAVSEDEAVAADRLRRWDGLSVHEFSGTYGAYLMSKVAKVFPDLGRDVGLEARENVGA